MANISKEERARRQAESAKQVQPVPQLVRMVRGPEYPRPHMADVHPEEVENYRAGGWVKAE